MIVIPDEGKLLLAYWMFSSDGSDLEDFVVDEFSNNETIDNDSTAGDFTIATYTGYAQVDVARADFGAPSIVSHVANITATPAPLFTCSGGSPQTVFGWIMRSASGGIIVAGQNYVTPRVMAPTAIEELTPFTIKTQTLH